MTDYITVVLVDNGAEKIPRHLSDTSTNATASADLSKDSQFITVLSINDTTNSNRTETRNVSMIKTSNDIQVPLVPEEVLVYRLPGERLGFGLKFQGGTRNAETIQKLFIQSCAADSPASRATTSWGNLREGDEIVEIDGIDVTKMTRLECVRCLKESNLAIRLLVRNGEGKAYMLNEVIEIKSNEKKQSTGPPPSPPPVPPRKINKRKSSTGSDTSTTKISTTNQDKPFTPPPDAEFYINLFAGKKISTKKYLQNNYTFYISF